MLGIEILHTFDTQYSADSVEWCQLGGNKNTFAVGTYQLEEKDENVSANNIRKGRIYLFEHDDETNELTQHQKIETDAILDQKWIECYDSAHLATATSSGKIQLYLLKDKALESVKEVSLKPDETGCLALSIDLKKVSSKVLASDSKGRIMLLDLEAPQPLMRQWLGHSFEAWTCAFDRFNESIVYSGGDDSVFNMWDLRLDAETMKVKTAKRDAGVTSFLSHKENILLVGSYDENLSVYDLRNFKRPTDEINLKGGIWRIKPAATNPNQLLVACMYHNFSIVDCSNELKLVGEHFGHESICYGCDWAPTEKDYRIFASCSFYDHKLTVCKVKL